MGLPGNWNSSSVRVDPLVLNGSAANLKSAIQNIQDDLSAIITALNDLKISWTGDSATVAAAAAKRWTDVTTELYGTQEHPEQGILNVLSGGIASDAVNYSKCESAVYDMFNLFENSLETAPGTGAPAPAPQNSIIDDSDGVTKAPYHTTSVNETF